MSNGDQHAVSLRGFLAGGLVHGMTLLGNSGKVTSGLCATKSREEGRADKSPCPLRTPAAHLHEWRRAHV
jgi:hypothetical protein